MTESQYKEAKLIEERITSVDAVLSLLECADDFKFDPPTRYTGLTLESSHGEKRCRILTESEVMCIKNALENEKIFLQKKFKNL